MVLGHVTCPTEKKFCQISSVFGFCIVSPIKYLQIYKGSSNIFTFMFLHGLTHCEAGLCFIKTQATPLLSQLESLAWGTRFEIRICAICCCWFLEARCRGLDVFLGFLFEWKSEIIWPFSFQNWQEKNPKRYISHSSGNYNYWQIEMCLF